MSGWSLKVFWRGEGSVGGVNSNGTRRLRVLDLGYACKVYFQGTATS